MERSLLGIVGALISVAVLACGDDSTQGGGGQGGTGNEGGGGTADTGGAPTTGGGPDGGAGGEVGGACAQGGSGGAGEVFVPAPDDVDFAAVTALPAGEVILYNDWNPIPNVVLSMSPDGSNEVTVFESYRVWSMSVSSDVSKIAFAAGDPDQAQHYGVTIGDAIQPTFLYDVATQTAENLTAGNINDECHRFGDDDTKLYVCRRYDFDDCDFPKGYRIGRVDIATKAFEWLTGEDDTTFALNPEPVNEASLLHTNIVISGNQHSIVRIPIPPAGGVVETLRSDAGVPRLSPDGTKVLFQDYTQFGALVVLDLETSGTTLVAQGDPRPSTGRWSPDGTRIAFLLDDSPNNCSDIAIAAADGSDAGAPTIVHDCSETGRFITELEWVSR